MPTLTPRLPQPPMGGAYKTSQWYRTLPKVIFTTGVSLVLYCAHHRYLPVIILYQGLAPMPGTSILMGKYVVAMYSTLYIYSWARIED